MGCSTSSDSLNQGEASLSEHGMAKHGILHASRGFTLLELLIVAVIIGILAMIALPLFNGMRVRAHQAETRANLSGVHVSEATYFGEWGRYGSFSEIGFALAGVSTRYTYRSPAAGGAAGSTNTANVDLLVPQGGSSSPDNTTAPSGATLSGGGGASFTATATGNLDQDVTLDQWHVNEQKLSLDFPDVNDG